MRKRGTVRWALVCSLVAVLGSAPAAQSAGAGAPETPIATTSKLPSEVAPTKPATPSILAYSEPLACRDRRKLRMGVASWYAGAAARRTASGEAFRPNEMTAASRSLPFNTRIRVTNLRNGRSVIVRINDRGPYLRGRILDLTPKAAEQLGMKTHGTAPIYIEIARRETQSAAAYQVNTDQR